MIGDIIAWIFGIGAVAVLFAAERAGRKRREEYHRALIREFSTGEEIQGAGEGSREKE